MSRPSLKHKIRYIKNRSKIVGRHFLNNSLGRLHCKLDSKRPNIAVFSSRRSGSTWLIEILSRTPRTIRMVEPFDVMFNDNPYAKTLPNTFGGHFFTDNKDQIGSIHNYLEDMLNGKKRLRTQWRPWQHNFHFFYDRIIFKFFYIKNFMFDILERYPLRGIFLLRHPVAASFSNLKLKWHCPLSDFLNSTLVVEKMLTREQVELCCHIQSEGTQLEKYTAAWFIEHKVPLSQLKTHALPSLMTIKYEDLLINFDQTLDSMCEFLEIEETQLLKKGYKAPSWNSLGSENKILNSSAEELANGWRKIVDWDETPYLKELFSRFPTAGYSLQRPSSQPKDRLQALSYRL